MSVVAPAPPISAHLAAAQHPEVVDDVDEVERHRDHAEQHVGHRQVQDEDVLRGAQQLQREYTRQGSSNFYHFMRHAQYSDTTDIVHYQLSTSTISGSLDAQHSLKYSFHVKTNFSSVIVYYLFQISVVL